MWNLSTLLLSHLNFPDLRIMLRHDVVNDFKESRAAVSYLCHPRPQYFFDLAQCEAVSVPGQPLALLRAINTTGFDWADYAINPDNTLSAVRQKKVELLELVLCGFLRIHNGSYKVRGFKPNDSMLVQALHRMQRLDSACDFEEVSRWVSPDPDESCDVPPASEWLDEMTAP